MPASVQVVSLCRPKQTESLSWSPAIEEQPAKSVLDEIVLAYHMTTRPPKRLRSERSSSARTRTQASHPIVDCGRTPSAFRYRARRSYGQALPRPNGRPIRSAAQLRSKTGLTPVGDRLQFTVERKGFARDVSVEVAPATDTAGTRASTAAGLSRPSTRERRAGSWKSWNLAESTGSQRRDRL